MLNLYIVLYLNQFKIKIVTLFKKIDLLSEIREKWTIWIIWIVLGLFWTDQIDHFRLITFIAFFLEKIIKFFQSFVLKKRLIVFILHKN